MGELASQFGRASADEVTKTRTAHGAFVAEKIGASYRFFDFGDSRVTGSRDQVLAVAKLYAEFQPDTVITWDDYSGHPDHRATAKLAFDAVTFARIPKIVSEGEAEPKAAHRKPVRIYQYHHRASPFPSVHIDISEQIGTVTEVFAFYRDFYGWKATDEQFQAQRAMIGREVGCRFAEHFQLRSTSLPAQTYLP